MYEINILINVSQFTGKNISKLLILNKIVAKFIGNVSRCNELEIQRYKNRLSEPFLDRIDLYVVMNDSFSDNKNIVNSKELHENVIKAFIKQKSRNQKELNGKLSEEEIKKYCILDDDAKLILEKARLNYQLTFRSINKVLKVARTIADLNDNEIISKNDLLQSLNFRRR